ncbi:FmdB family zinc ribbon protein [Candidatus Latescibacterota bacterium]
MPTYEYVCTKCGHEFEEFQTMSEEPVKNCPKCKGAVQRIISGGMFCVKGKELEKIKENGSTLDHYCPSGH